MLPPSVNLHLIKACNLRCRFCFATFRDVRGGLGVDELREVIAMVRDAGAEKLTFAGGEPTLHPHLGDLLAVAKDLGLVTCIVTNGARLEPLLRERGESVDWVGLSVDSAIERVQAELGRGRGDHVARSIRLADLCRQRAIHIKLNSVVTQLTWEEDMSPLVRAIAPARWKVFQVLKVEGQNDGSVEPLLIRADQFDAFVARHKHLEQEGFPGVPESNAAMTDSYAMIDPLGRFYGDTGGVHRVSPPIREVGVEAALESIGFRAEKFAGRNGLYEW